ncbi:hypothetical protein EDD68_10126 [Melghiribacillus thermohalophilus]|uniref:Uncharacterized protein n=1 Tax=Melghiribacillus thermohalophilus TaxID=1324956 RepID=A0A4R3NCH6_9BACI|nr:hypothetical protein EDD68_10126 [Melghiribacillus thermohalophilus]
MSLIRRMGHVMANVNPIHIFERLENGYGRRIFIQVAA